MNNAFQTPAPIAISVDVLSAEVTVIASDRADTVVTVAPADAAKKGDVRAAERTTVDFAAGVLTVRTPKNWRTYTPFGGNPSIRVTIEAPAASQLKATSGVGRLRTFGALGQSDLEIALGDILVDLAADSVTAKTAKGDIRIADAVRGVLNLETSVGELEVGIHPGSAAHLETSAQRGSVRNQLAPVALGSGDADTVQVFIRNSLGDIIIRQAA
ncbi:DUF4097 family beta strand repeat-containing protein [Nocardia acidivorans]|uniref:DUF4097 family beta strand repeat-containing protein n=1 Tax=Nocardia acidivorans TaxID=404580 RepID=UPI0008371A27|nr:DUF4097 family beta strand repeat-containing protein [Nocardia acidivorans]